MFDFPDKMMKVFKNDSLQEEFEKNGYVIVPFYNQEDIDELINLYAELHPVDETGFFPSTFSQDKQYRNTADQEIRRIGLKRIQELCEDFKVVCGSFIVKFPGPKSIMNVHQDMTLVDESKYTGINIWCPLIDLNESNGSLWILPGSHRLFPTYRGSTIPDIYEKVKDEIIACMSPLFLKAGQAVIFDQSVIHYSPPNESNEKRIVTNTYFTHKEAAFRIAYFNREVSQDQVEVFEQDDSFMTDFEQFGENIFDRPKIGKSLGLKDYNFPAITVDQLKEKYGYQEAPNGGFNFKSIISRFKEIISK